MYIGYAIQSSHNTRGLARTRQTMVFPALGLLAYRRISADAPKARWQVDSFATTTGALSHSYLDSASDIASITVGARRYVTGLGVGFQITDDEAAELVASKELPRNVPLRYQRALHEAGVTLHGAGASDSGVVRSRSQNVFLDAGIPMSTTMHAAMVADLDEWIARVADNDTIWLSARTHHAATAKGAGPHRSVFTVEPVLRDRARAEDAEDVVRKILVAAPVAPVPAVAAAHAVKVGARVPMPRGREYIARKIVADSPFSDVAMVRTAVQHGKNVFLYGPPGTGKTTLLIASFPDALVVPITGDTEVGDLVGSYVQTAPDSFEWVDGPLLRAMTEGKHIVLDEIGLADVRVLAVVYPLMDGQGQLRVTQNPLRGVVEAAPGFSISATTNPDAPGVMLSEALLSRFHVHMLVSTDYNLALTLGVENRIVEAAQHLAKMGQSGELSVNAVPQLRELLTFRDNAAIFGQVFALRSLIGWAPDVEREVVETVLRERYGDIPGAKAKIRALAPE